MPDFYDVKNNGKGPMLFGSESIEPGETGVLYLTDDQYQKFNNLAARIGPIAKDEDAERDPPWHFEHKWIEGLHFIDDEWIAYGVKGTVLNPNIANEIAGVLNSQHGTHLAADDISINRVRKMRGNNEYYFIIAKNHWPTVNKFKRKLKSVTSNRDESKMENDTAAPVLGKWQEGIFKPPGGGYAFGVKSPTVALNKGSIAKLIVIQAKERLNMDVEPKQISFGALLKDKSTGNMVATFMINSKDAAALVATPDKPIVVWGLPKGKKDKIHETLLAESCKNETDVEKVKAAASKDGWHSFRVTQIDLNKKPNFKAGINKASYDANENTDTAALELTAADGEKLSSGIKAPFVGVKLSTLGGAGRQSLMITVSLDAKSDWKNGILQNSRYAQIRLDNDGTLEHFSGRVAPKYNMRKAKVKSVDEAIAKINKFITGAPKVDTAANKVSYSDYIGKQTSGSVGDIRAYLEDGGIIWANPSTKKKGGFSIFVVGGPTGPLATVNNVADLRAWMKTYRVKPKNVENGGDLWKALSKVPGWNKDAAHTDEAAGGTWAIFGRGKDKNHFGLLAARIDKEATIQTAASKKGTGHYAEVKVMKVTAADMEALRSGQGKKVLIKYGLYKDTANEENTVTEKTDTAAPAAGAMKPYFHVYKYDKESKSWDSEAGFKTAKEAKEEIEFVKSYGDKYRIVQVPYKMKWTREVADKIEDKLKSDTGKGILNCMDCASAETENEDTAKLGPNSWYYVLEEATQKLVLKTKDHSKVKEKCRAMFKAGTRFTVRAGSDGPNKPAAVKARVKAGTGKTPAKGKTASKKKNKDKASVEATVIDQAAFDNLDVAARLDFATVISELLNLFSKTPVGSEKTMPWHSTKSNAVKSILHSFATRIQQTIPEFSLNVGDNWAVTIKRPDGMTMNKFALALRPPKTA